MGTRGQTVVQMPVTIIKDKRMLRPSLCAVHSVTNITENIPSAQAGYDQLKDLDLQDHRSQMILAKTPCTHYGENS